VQGGGFERILAHGHLQEWGGVLGLTRCGAGRARSVERMT
jgi:hypothetical protein